jgi:beta-lactamase class A
LLDESGGIQIDGHHSLIFQETGMNSNRIVKRAIGGALAFGIAAACCAQAQETFSANSQGPLLSEFHALPAPDKELSEKIANLVKQAKLDEHTPANKNPDREEEWASICVVDLSDVSHPRVGGWEMDNFVYPASAYKMYVLGEAIRQVCAGERSLDDLTTVSDNNMRSDSALTTSAPVTLAEVLRLMCMYSDNTAANVAIDTVNRKRTTALLHALGCNGSEITRKFIPRTREDAEFTSAPGTVSCARHFATFLWAAESGAIGGGRGRALIKSYLAMNVQNGKRIGAGIPPSATIFSKTGEWSTFTSEAALIEDGKTRYILCVLTALPRTIAEPRIAEFTKEVHKLMSQR